MANSTRAFCSLFSLLTMVFGYYEFRRQPARLAGLKVAVVGRTRAGRPRVRLTLPLCAIASRETTTTTTTRASNNIQVVYRKL